MFRSSLCTLFLLVALGTNAQDSEEITALELRLENSSPDTVRCQIFIDMAKEYFGSDPDTAFYYGSQARDLGRELEEPEWEAQGLLHMARALGYQGEVEEAKVFHREIIDLYLRNDMKQKTGGIYIETGVEHIYAAQYDSSLIYLQRAKDIFEEFQDTMRLGSTYNNMAIVLRRMALYDEARDFYQRSYDMRELIGNKKGMAMSLLNIGVLYFYQDKNDSSLASLEKALDIAVEIDEQSTMAHILQSMSANNQFLGNHSVALKQSQDALRMFDELDEMRQVQLLYASLGNCYGNLGQCDSALYYLDLCASEGIAMSFRQQRLSNHVRALCAVESGDLDQAVKYKDLEIAYMDSVANERQRDRVAAIQVRYEQEVRKSDLAAKDKEIAEGKVYSSRQNTIIVAIGALLLLLTSAFVIFRQQAKRSQDQMLANVRAHMNEISMLQNRVAEMAEAPKPDWQPTLSGEEMNTYLLDPLTERELDILKLIAQGKTNTAIAEESHVSVNTVKTHVKHIYDKLDVRNRTQATIKADQLNLLSQVSAEV